METKTMTQWENEQTDPTQQNPDQYYTDEEPDSENNPFGGVEQVDGIVYSQETMSPELQWQNQPVVPPPPVRERPRLETQQYVEPWKPGPDPTPPQPKTSNGSARIIAATTIPLIIIVGLGILVYRIMQAYGL